MQTHQDLVSMGTRLELKKTEKKTVNNLSYTVATSCMYSFSLMPVLGLTRRQLLFVGGSGACMNLHVNI